MTNLQRFVVERNTLNQIFSRSKKVHLLSLNNAKDRKEIRDCLEGELSPENLCCDGELNGRMLMNKARYLNGAMEELNVLDKKYAR